MADDADHHDYDDLLHLISDCISDGIQCDKSCCEDSNLKAKILCHVVTNKLSNEPQPVIDEMIYVAFSDQSDEQKEEEKADNNNQIMIESNDKKSDWLVSEYDNKFIKSKAKKTIITDSDIENCKSDLKGLLSYTQNELVQQCSNMECCTNAMFISKVDEKYNGPLDVNCESRREYFMKNCAPLQRIKIMLKLYWHLIKKNNSANTMFHLLEQCGYTHQQLFDDFSHVKIIHIDADNNAYQRGDGYYNIGMYLCKYFQNLFPCDIDTCKVFKRHHRDRGAKSANQYANHEEKEAAFQQECDKIHSYFFQFGV